MTDSYSLFIKRAAERELRRISKSDLSRILTKIQNLIQTPRPNGSEKLAEQERYRIRQGDYRIIYTIDDEKRRIDVIKIGHRREVYRKS
ncbi:MAG: hypothetical protein NPIRA04_30070 [Nitrospirales bacterium]|nr:MAG: hypothetical protein NPIRA04_30070 [Nitrospirales bacterium]